MREMWNYRINFDATKTSEDETMRKTRLKKWRFCLIEIRFSWNHIHFLRAQFSFQSRDIQKRYKDWRNSTETKKICKKLIEFRQQNISFQHDASTETQQSLGKFNWNEIDSKQLDWIFETKKKWFQIFANRTRKKKLREFNWNQFDFCWHLTQLQSQWNCISKSKWKRDRYHNKGEKRSFSKQRNPPPKWRGNSGRNWWQLEWNFRRNQINETWTRKSNFRFNFESEQRESFNQLGSSGIIEIIKTIIPKLQLKVNCPELIQSKFTGKID